MRRRPTVRPTPYPLLPIGRQCLIIYFLEMVDAMLTVRGHIPVDHETTLAISFRVKPSLNAFDEVDIFGLKNFLDVIHRRDFFFVRRLHVEEEVPVLKGRLGACWHDMHKG